MFNFIKFQKKNKVSRKRGFVILIASLLAGSFLIIGSAIFNISLKELILSSGGKDSQFAFYAADTGIECALYWDINGNVFATSTYSSPEPTNVYCADQNITGNASWLWKDPAATTNTSSRNFFSFKLFPNDPNHPDCVIVSVSKSSGVTLIESRGYNTCDSNNPRRVERGLRITY